VLEQKPSLLWLVSKWPYPARDGSQLATHSLLRELTSHGIVIDLLVLTAESPEVDLEEIRAALKLRSIQGISTPPPARSVSEQLWYLLQHLFMSPLVPFTLVRFGRSEISHAITMYKRGEFYSYQKIVMAGSPRSDWLVTVYEGVHTAAHLMRSGLVRPPPNLPIMYRAQNCEMMLWRTRAHTENSFFIKLFLYFQSFLMKRTEDSLLRAAYSYAAISEEDMNLFARAAPQTRGSVVPVSFRFSDPLPPSTSSSLHLLFVGKLDWYPNQDGLQWFLSEVWPEVMRRRPNSVVTIVGSGKSEWMNTFKGIPGVVFCGFVESLETVYRNAHLALVPIRYGSGVKVKALEAAGFGRASLMTPNGASGTCFRDRTSGYIAQSADEWKEIICSINTEEASALGIAAYNAARKAYDPQYAVSQFLSLLPERSFPQVDH
jgi:polysaccharide biosynthesis protein PslH